MNAFASVRAAHLSSAADRARIALGPARRQQPLEELLAKDVLWLIEEIRRLEEIVLVSGLAINHGQPQ